MSQIIGPITNEIINTLTLEIKKPEVRQKLVDMITPLINEIFSQYIVYIIAFGMLQVIIILLLITIILMLNK